jgi:hypothetical protein
MKLDRQTLTLLREDVASFAEHVVGEPLWPHQVDLARDPARIRVVCSGRQAGKSRTLAILALHEAFRAGRRNVLLISAGEAAARDLLGEVAMLSQAPALAGSVVDESASVVRLSNGSVIRSVPASPKAVRGKSIDLLVMDEAGFIADELWQAAKFTVIARPESRVILASTPWGREDRFFAVAYRAGQRQEAGHSSHHWPSTVSPLVDRTLLEMFRATMTDREYRTEVLAEWVDASGAYFDSDELEAAVALGGAEGSPLWEPEACFFASCGRLEAEVGVDWGFARDANAAVAVAAVPGELPFAGEGRLWIPWLSERYGVTYERFIEELVRAGSTHGLRFRAVRAETNGVGAMPTQVLRRRMGEAGAGAVSGVATTAGSKADTFGAIKLLLQSERLVLPRYPELLRQLGNLEFEQLEGGGVRIAVPERRGHDDLVMALSFAMLPAVEAATRAASGGLTVWNTATGQVAYTENDPRVNELARQFMASRRAERRGFPAKPAGISDERYARILAARSLGMDWPLPGTSSNLR